MTSDELDTLARSWLYFEGIYNEGTYTHGIGHFLCVHEYPPLNGPYLENMIIANEPGYYEDGKFGIRIEN